jgi:hypothetical protein
VLRSSVIILAVLLSLVVPASANAKLSRRLSIATAQRAITVYEGEYWTGQRVTLNVGHCQHHGARQVSCLAEAVKPGQTVVVRDWATLLPQGIIRIHPGSIATTITLESESPAVEG